MFVLPLVSANTPQMIARKHYCVNYRIFMCNIIWKLEQSSWVQWS
jgi:hypothetical protein